MDKETLEKRFKVRDDEEYIQCGEQSGQKEQQWKAGVCLVGLINIKDANMAGAEWE